MSQFVTGNTDLIIFLNSGIVLLYSDIILHLMCLCSTYVYVYHSRSKIFKHINQQHP